MPTVNSPSLQLNPVIQEVWNRLKTERRPLSTQDFTGLDPKLVAEALASLHRQGYVYNVEGLWAPTQATVTNKAKTYTPAEEITEVKLPSKNFYDNYLAPALSHFLKIHPEYKATFDFLFKNPVYKKGITEDIQKILSREYVKFDPRKSTIPRYKYPEILNSVEQALVEELGEINKYHSSLKGKVPSVATNKATADFFNQLMQAQGDQIVANVLNEAGLGRPGHILTEAEIKQTIANGSVKEVIKNKRLVKEVFQDYLYNAISNSPYAKEHNILVEGMGDEDILRIFGIQLQANLKRAAEVINNFRSSGLIKKYSGILSSRGLKEANFMSADLSNLVIANSDFTDANFSNAKFDETRIKNNNFYKAKFTDASLVNVAAFEDNIIGQADFQGAAIPKGFPDESNTGVPINLNFHEIAHSKEGLDAALNLKSHSVHSLPLEEEEIDDAKAIMKALHGVLQHRNVLGSLKLSWEESPTKVNLINALRATGYYVRSFSRKDTYLLEVSKVENSRFVTNMKPFVREVLKLSLSIIPEAQVSLAEGFPFYIWQDVGLADWDNREDANEVTHIRVIIPLTRVELSFTWQEVRDKLIENGLEPSAAHKTVGGYAFNYWHKLTSRQVVSVMNILNSFVEDQSLITHRGGNKSYRGWHYFTIKRPIAKASLSLTASSLTEGQVQQLRDWVLNPEALPDFLPPDSMNWLVSKNKSGELAAAGLVKAEINKLFGRVRNLSAPKEPIVSPEEQKKQLQNQSVDQFVNKYKDADELPVDDVLSLIPENKGELYNLISAYGPMLSQAEARAILHGLESSLKKYHVPKSVTPRKWIKAFPYSVTMNNLKTTGTSWSVAGGGKQFGILIRPNLAQMSPELANSAMTAIQGSGTHLLGALAFSRIMPYHYTAYAVRGTEPPVVKNVWFISEMQSDAYQKGNDSIKSKEEAKEFRNYFRHWPEVLLGAIITQAQKAGVDEIWIPEGKEVIAKTNASDLKEDSWDYAYDRPAKAYGGKLKSIGDNITLDPGSGYKRTTNMAYVIDISGIKQKAFLKLSWEDNPVVNNTTELIQLLAPFQVWELSDTKTPYLYLGEKPSLFEVPDVPSGYTVNGTYMRVLTNTPNDMVRVGLPFREEYPLTLVSEDWREIDKEANLKTFAKAIDDYRENITHHMKFIVDENLPKFPVVSKYVTMDMLAQFAFKTFFDEYGVSEELKNDPEFIGDVKKVFEEEFGAKIWGPPYIDWLYWLQKALNDVLYYVHNQRHNIQPDMTVSDQELARDWFKFWVKDQVPEDMKTAPWFEFEFVSAIQRLVKGQGLGDIFSTGFIPPQTIEERTQQIIHPVDTGEGEKMLEGEEGGLLPEEEELKPQPSEKDIRFLSPSERRKTIDKYLDELSTAQATGDNVKVNEIKQKLQELSLSSSLKLSWEEQVQPHPKDDVYPYSVKAPTSPRVSGTYLWILKSLYEDGPQRVIQLWEKYVSERKGKDPDKLRKNYYDPASLDIWNRGVSVEYYQGVSSRINDLVHFGWIGKSAETRYYYVLLPAGLEELKKAGMV